jgi:hypothetical protein
MKRNRARRHYQAEGNEEVLEAGLLLQEMKSSAPYAIFASVCLALFCCLPCALVRAQAQNADPPRTIHVFVALADNQHQGIIPVPPKLGNADDPDRNLYWGAAYGVKTLFAHSADWQLLAAHQKPKPEVLERCIFRHRTQNVYLVADAYQGRQIKQAIVDFLSAAAGQNPEALAVQASSQAFTVHAGGSANLVAYVGHEGLMDFSLPALPRRKDATHRDAMILACISKSYFAAPLRAVGAQPLVWTTGLMAPEAYTLKSALDGWMFRETDDQIRERAAQAYSKYQHCSLAAARRLLVTGW